MANTARVTATINTTVGNITLAHNLGRTPHYVVPCSQAATATLGGVNWSEVSRDASVFVVSAVGSAIQPCQWEVIFKHSSIR